MECYGVSCIGAKEPFYSRFFIVNGASTSVWYHIPDDVLSCVTISFDSWLWHKQCFSTASCKATVKWLIKSPTSALGVSLCLKPLESCLHGILRSAPLACNEHLRLILRIRLIFHNANISRSAVFCCFPWVSFKNEIEINGGRQYPRRQRF